MSYEYEPHHPTQTPRACLIYVVRGRPGQADRPALPAGHPVSWGAITEGTVLAESVYPFPVFLN